MAIQILNGDCMDVLPTLADGSVQMVVTSPPYWGLRDYGIPASVWDGDPACEHVWGDTISVNATNHTTKARWNHTRNGRDELQPPEKRVSWLRTHVKQGQFCQRCGAWAGAFGLEPTYQAYVQHAVGVFREVRRVLRDDGTLWLNVGDSYCSGNRATWRSGASENKGQNVLNDMPRPAQPSDLKPKDLIGLPWRVAFALQADGWWLRSEIIWAKPNPMPESVTDRPSSSHEHLFLLAKSERYFYDAEAVKEPCESGPSDRRKMIESKDRIGGKHKTLVDPLSKASASTAIGRKRSVGDPAGRNCRDVWTIATQPFPDAHFATFAPALAERCISAGSRPGDTILDPFAGAFTAPLVADRLRRHAIGIERNPEYCTMAERRIRNDAGMFADVAAQ